MGTRTRLSHVLYLSLLSRPAQERILYRNIVRQRIARIVELGIGDGTRARRMISAALRGRLATDVHYTGIDLFESRSDNQPGLTLKRAHRHLGETGVRVRLLPGDPYAALARHANALSQTDLVVIAAEVDPESLTRGWFYLPRMLHARSLVFSEEVGEQGHRWTALHHEEITLRAKTSRAA